MKEEKDEEETLDFREFGRRLEIYKRLFAFHEMKNPRQQQLMAMYEQVARNQSLQAVGPESYKQGVLSSDSSLMFDLERDLFPWAHKQFPTLMALKKSYQGRGIVIPTGSKLLRFATHLIRSLRFFNCTLPILAAYAGDHDLQKHDRDYLEQKLQVGLLDVTEYFNNTLLKLNGWEIKPFALLAAPFQEVILMDADCVILRDPEELFSDKGYLTHHIVLFRDRTTIYKDCPQTWVDTTPDREDWFRTRMPLPLSEAVLKSRMYQGKSIFEVDSGLAVWNKQHRFFGLLATCKMNAFVERTKLVYKVFLGDKESFWLGPELARETYTDFQSTPASIGTTKMRGNEVWVCGSHMLHLDRQGQPLWFNAGIVGDKYNRTEPTLRNDPGQFTHWAVEGVWAWDPEAVCLNGNVKPVSRALGATIDALKHLWI